MTTPQPIVDSLDALAALRASLAGQLAQLGRALQDNELLDEADANALAALRDRLASDKLVLAFVAEFSRGKSELINAIFFADAGRRVLPATPGRTTMCPVELRFDAGRSARLSLLPIETRLQGLGLADLRLQDEVWTQVALDPSRRDDLALALSAVTQTQQVSVEQARALGLWSDTQPEDNPPQDADGRVEVPTWRHALINYPHPLLARGLVVIDTPGLNAVGAEPELTLSLLPSAHAVLFVLAADTGVTRTDLAVWREHLGVGQQERFVVLNKIDALADPLLSTEQVAEQIETQCEHAARTLGVPRARVHPLSARAALTARVDGDAAALQASGLPALELALMDGLLPQRQALLLKSTTSVVEQLQRHAQRRLNERGRQFAEQLLELRGLRGKSAGKLRMLLDRLDSECADFERCTVRLAALRTVQLRIQRALMADLSSERLRKEMGAMQAALGAWPFKLGAQSAFDDLMSRLRSAVASAATQANEMQNMLDAGFRQLNTEFGFSFALTPLPSLAPTLDALDKLEQSYRPYLGLGQAWRLASPGFAQQFRRMLMSKLRVMFENAATEFELWIKSASGQINSQTLERRRGFARRREALQRVQAAAGDLEARIADVQIQDEKLAQLKERLQQLAAQALATASTSADAMQAEEADIPLPMPHQDAA